MSSPAITILADECARFLRAYKAENYVHFDMMPRPDHGMKPIRVTVQWANGMSPAEKADLCRRGMMQWRAIARKWHYRASDCQAGLEMFARDAMRNKSDLELALDHAFDLNTELHEHIGELIEVFTPLTDSETEMAVEALRAVVRNGSDRLHAAWARRLARSAREQLSGDDKENGVSGESSSPKDGDFV
ncbi:MAG TPA: hypothetical protein VJG32_18095 [Anaerolineae bacterium]|nr:hypothetical protein [Anaerolineae bacterium]